MTPHYYGDIIFNTQLLMYNLATATQACGYSHHHWIEFCIYKLHSIIDFRYVMTTDRVTRNSLSIEFHSLSISRSKGSPHIHWKHSLDYNNFIFPGLNILFTLITTKTKRCKRSLENRVFVAFESVTSTWLVLRKEGNVSDSCLLYYQLDLCFINSPIVIKSSGFYR